MAERRSWEDWWEREAEADFLRWPGAENQPRRVRMCNEAAKVGGSVLEVGCATGIDYPRLKRLGLKYTGIDVTSKFISRAKELYPEIDVRVANVLDLPFADDSFDVVYANDVVQHLDPKEYPKALREMWRVAQKLLLVSTSRQFIFGNGEIIPKMGTSASSAVNGPYMNHYNFDRFLAYLQDLPDSNVAVFHGFMTLADRRIESFPILHCPECKSKLTSISHILCGWDRCFTLFRIYNDKNIELGPEETDMERFI